MKTYPVFNAAGGRSPIFQVDGIYIGLGAVARLLVACDGVTDVRQRKAFSSSSDVHFEFKYHGRPFIVWEPYGDNSRYWIGPADMAGEASDVARQDFSGDIGDIERSFKRYRPPIYRAILGDVVTFRFIHCLVRKREESK